jgi:hypothetical protein
MSFDVLGTRTDKKRGVPLLSMYWERERIRKWVWGLSLTSVSVTSQVVVRFPVKPIPHVIEIATLSDSVGFLRGLFPPTISQYCQLS